MKLIDTHAHLQFKAYDPDRDIVVKRNSDELEAVINVGAAIDSSESGVELAEKISNFYASVGVHPHHSDQWNSETLRKLSALARQEKVVAIGEIGLDLHQYKPLRVLRSDELEDYPKPQLKNQTKMLHDQTEIAIKLKLPVIFHCRDAYDELYEEIKQYRGKLTGVVHCFMGNWQQAVKFLNFGLYISFTGNLTYKNNDALREIAKKIPDEQILIETDAPYLPPEPYRGQRNEPIYVKIVASTLSNIKGWDLQKTIEKTSQNAKNLFKIT